MVVTGVGQCCWDTLAVVGEYPTPDSKVEALAWEEQGGGPVATALVTLARLGVSCRFAGVVGDDETGRRIAASLREEGIDLSSLAVRSGASSQRAFIVVERGSGRRTIVWQRSRGAALLPEELPAGLWDGCGALHLDGILPEASLAAAREARLRGVPVMVDAGRMRPAMLDIARLSDYVVGAEQFFLDLGWRGTPEHFRELAAGLGAPVVTVTCGAGGSLTWAGGEQFFVPAFPVSAVDTTGAGDVFHGGYLYGILRGWELRETVRFASAAAALKCRHLGAQRGIPRLPEVFAFLAEAGGGPAA